MSTSRNDYLIFSVEQALGIALYDYQREILKGNLPQIPQGRRSGKTTIFMVDELTDYDDYDRFNYPIRIGPGRGYRHYQWYAQEFREIRDKLVKYGIPCREIIVSHDYYRGRRIGKGKINER